jgi:Lon protease-like protein
MASSSFCCHFQGAPFFTPICVPHNCAINQKHFRSTTVSRGWWHGSQDPALLQQQPGSDIHANHSFSSPHTRKQKNSFFVAKPKPKPIQFLLLPLLCSLKTSRPQFSHRDLPPIGLEYVTRHSSSTATRIWKTGPQNATAAGSSGFGNEDEAEEEDRDSGDPYSSSSDEFGIHLCIFPLQSAGLPTSSGQLHVYESHYVQMFEVVMEVAKAEGNIAKFGMLLDAKALDCHNSRDDNDLSRRQQSSNQLIGCCCHVESISDHAGHKGIVVDYRCINRFYVKDVKLDKPFHVVSVEWLKDYPPHVLGGSSTQTRQDHLEREVWRVLSSVAAITAKLESASSKSEVMKSSKVLYNWLPAQVRQFAPLPSWTRSTFAPNQHVAKDVAIWRQNSLRNAGDNPATAVPSPYDDEEANPYWYAREKLVKLIRQEAFSFAAATTVEAGPEEISALLHTCDTSTRLSWVLDAVQPYLAKLEAQNSLLEAMGTMH